MHQGPWWAANSNVTVEPVQPRQVIVQNYDGALDTPEHALMAPHRSKATKSLSSCPQCGDPAYVPLINNAMVPCPACGYNTRFTQAGGLGGLPAQGGASAPARQTLSGGRGGVSQRITQVTEHISSV